VLFTDSVQLRDQANPSKIQLTEHVTATDSVTVNPFVVGIAAVHLRGKTASNSMVGKVGSLSLRGTGGTIELKGRTAT